MPPAKVADPLERLIFNASLAATNNAKSAAMTAMMRKITPKLTRNLLKDFPLYCIENESHQLTVSEQHQSMYDPTSQYWEFGLKLTLIVPIWRALVVP